MSALKKLMVAGQHDSLLQESAIDVEVIDRIKENYLDHVQAKMDACKGIDAKKLTKEQILAQKQINEERTLGVKAFQARTTYEIGRGDENSKEGGLGANRLLERHIRSRAVSNGQKRNCIPLKIEDEMFER